jgi:hypothetical protein
VLGVRAVPVDAMGKHDKVKEQVCSGKSNANIDFDDLCRSSAFWDSKSEQRAAITFSQNQRSAKSLICSLIEMGKPSLTKCGRFDP